MSQSRSSIPETPDRPDQSGQGSASTQIPDDPETSEFHLQRVMDTIPGLVWSAFADGSVEFCNQSWLHYTGLSLDQARGGELAEAIHPQDKSDFHEKWRAALTQGASFEAETRMRRADGSHRWFLIRAVPLRDAKGGIIRWYGTNVDIEDLKRAHDDITERKRSEERLRESENRFRVMADTAPVMIWMTGTDGLCNYFNKPWLEFTGRTMEQEVGTGWIEGVHPDDVQGCFDGFLPAFQERKPFRMEYRLRRANGEYRWLLESGIPRYTGDGEFAGYVGSNIDITDIKRAEEERRAHLWFLESMDRVNRAIQATNDLERMMGDVLDAVLAIFDCDRAWLVYPCDPKAPSWTLAMERARQEFPGAFTVGRDLPMTRDVAEVFQTVRASSSPARFGPESKHPLPAETAERFSIQSVMGMAIHPKGDKPYMFGLHQCSYPRIWTAQEERLFQEIGRRLEDALTSVLIFRNLGESERKLEEAQRLAHVGYWDRDLDTGLITWSDETYRIYGLPPGEILTLERIQQLIHSEDRPMMLAAISAALHGERRYDIEYRVSRRDGELRALHSQADVKWDESGRPRRMFGTVQDITERKRVEEELRAAETRFRTYVDHATDALFVHGDQRKIVEVNRQACESLGYTREELIGMTPTDFDPALGMNAAFIQWMKERLEAGEVFAFETSHRRKDGTLFPVEVRVRPFWHGVHRFGLALVRDITERKRAEETLRQTQAELAHVARVATLGELAASIAHEVNQPLAAIVTNGSACLRWLMGDSPKLEEARETARRIIRDGKRASDVIARIRGLVQKTDTEKARLDINQAVQEVINLTQHEAMRKGVTLRTELVSELPPVLGDRVQLQQVILNLVMNGIEAMENVTDRPRELLIRSSEDASDKVLVAVQDSGIGIDAQHLEKIFDTFYTTKPQGMGMGLAISRSIVEAHGGRLRATANDDRGATFQFTLPAGSRRE